MQNERIWRITQISKRSFNHPSVAFTADAFRFLIKTGDKECPRVGAFLIWYRTSTLDQIAWEGGYSSVYVWFVSLNHLTFLHYPANTAGIPSVLIIFCLATWCIQTERDCSWHDQHVIIVRARIIGTGARSIVHLNICHEGSGSSLSFSEKCEVTGRRHKSIPLQVCLLC